MSFWRMFSRMRPGCPVTRRKKPLSDNLFVYEKLVVHIFPSFVEKLDLPTSPGSATSDDRKPRRLHYQYYRKMNTMPNHADFMELGTIHQHQSNCKQHCFVFTEIADIDLPPEITKFPEKIKNGSIHSYSKKDGISCLGIWFRAGTQGWNGHGARRINIRSY
ncbi:dipeptidase [Culex quinquefasciatus]|uniref:Dipeptidase n=1 Tax=Culex quinquefasciatus TaxID=7176 RepID=B0XBH0_CULQU|nr:dipeptidase [Culex quinquefasciatus]|eukprot:XP_001866992.1 dipeptidase [Culex quinquefasciatus]